jgi:serine protease Do
MTQNPIARLMIASCFAALPAKVVCQQPTSGPPAEVRQHSQFNARASSEMLTKISDSLEQLASKVSPAVVQIEVTGFGTAEGHDRRGSNTAVMVRQRAIGAGVIVDPDGYVMTNAHVVAGAEQIRVVLPAVQATFFDISSIGNAQVLNAKLIGTQKDCDLALLKVEAANLPALHFNLEHSPQLGELVFAVGSPEGLQSSVTMGVVSSALRQPDPDNPMVYVQTDAPINPGNSGGPLVDVTGAIIGLNTFILSSSGGSQGLGFAIPAPIVNFVYQSLRKYGHVRHIEIGAFAQTITPAMADGLGLAQNWGVVLADVEPDGAAYAAGLRPGDVVLDIDGHGMLGLPGFAVTLYQHPIDQEVKIDVLRGTQKLAFNVAPILARDRMDELAGVVNPIISRIGSLGILGVDFDSQVRSLLPDARFDTGVVVVGLDRESNLVDTGLQTGDIIHSLNRTPIASVEQLRSAAAQLKPQDSVVLHIERGGQFKYLAFEME